MNCMNKKIAETLISELERHCNIITIDSELFLEALVSTNIPESSRFYEIIPYKQQLVEEDGRYHFLSLRRVLRNKNARDYKLTQWKKAYESIISAFGSYSSNTLTRNLRSNNTLVEMMSRCKEPFSILGKLKTYNFDNPDNIIFSASRPVLIIPCVSNIKPIRKWEEENTTYEKEIRLMGFFTIQKMIKPKEYFSH